MNEEQRCKTCKYWGKVMSDQHVAPGCAECALGKYAGGYDIKTMPDDRVLADDAEGYCADVVTCPNFGCIHWQAKEG